MTESAWQIAAALVGWVLILIGGLKHEGGLWWLLFGAYVMGSAYLAMGASGCRA